MRRIKDKSIYDYYSYKIDWDWEDMIHYFKSPYEYSCETIYDYVFTE